MFCVAFPDLSGSPVVEVAARVTSAPAITVWRDVEEETTATAEAVEAEAEDAVEVADTEVN